MASPSRVYPRLPVWAAVLYAILAVILIPWITYLAVTLPARHLSRHWDVSWVGLDIAIAFMLVLNSVFSYFESPWLPLSATATATLLCTDAWFDVISSHPGLPLVEALGSAVGIELPLAGITLFVAVKSLQRVKRR